MSLNMTDKAFSARHPIPRMVIIGMANVAPGLKPDSYHPSSPTDDYLGYKVQGIILVEPHTGGCWPH